ncbi:MAG TPA: NADH-quinone oxidoreductase subunit H, partial [Armatimonadota bacterium]|nr:NADH-quinone oxidoreductase subunit H [Armatimonadota bacterium]
YAGLTSATDWTFKWGTIPAAILAGIVLVAGLLGFISVVVTLMKASMLVFVLMWLRGTLPRVRVDQLMGFAWKVLVPLGLLNFLALAFQAATGFPSGWILNGLFLLGLVLLVVFGWRKRWAYSHV